MTKAVKREFLAADAYGHWKRRVTAAQESIRVYSPYLDALVVSLLCKPTPRAECMSVVTDLSPDSGTRTYRGQLLAIRRLLSQGVEVRSLPRLHAKVLLIDGASVTVGSQNFTSYARKSKETTAVPALDMSESQFVETLQRWYEMAEPVDSELIDRLLADLAAPLETALAAIETLSTEYDKVVADYRETQRMLAQQRLERDAAEARAAVAAAAMRRAAAASPYSPVGQSVAYASLKRDGDSYFWTLEAERGVDLTEWFGVDEAGQLDSISLDRLYFYPVLRGSGMRMAFARVTGHRITYVSRGIHGGTVTMRDIPLHFTITFPNDDPDGVNLVITFHWRSKRDDDDYGYQVRLLFDGEQAERIAEGPIGNNRRGHWLTTLVQSTYEDLEAWDAVLRAVFAPTRLTGFIRDHNADTFFPRDEWLRITPIRFVGTPVLLIQ